MGNQGTKKFYILFILIFATVLVVNLGIGGFDSLFWECDASEPPLPDSQFCLHGRIRTLDQLSEPQVHDLYRNVYFGTPKPSLAKRTFVSATSGTPKLEIVLIELKAAPVDTLIPTIYNIGHIHGGHNDTAFTVLYHDFHHSGIASTIQEWPTVRWIKMSGQLTIPDYNRMTTSVKFWDQFQSQFILITHTDSIIFRRFDQDFYNYEYVGPPWLDPNLCGLPRPAVGNGGYSLRNVSWHKKIVSADKYDDQLPEDLWWCRRANAVPDRDTAMRFGTEQTWYNGTEGPSGSHRLPWMRGPFNKAGGWLRIFMANNYETDTNTSKRSSSSWW